MAIGRPSSSAVSVPAPEVMANATPRMPPVTTSGGIDAPTEKDPINASSSVAPMITPVCTSPSTSPVSSPVTIGREISDVPNAYSDCAINATRPSKRASTIICPPELNAFRKKLFAIVRDLADLNLDAFPDQLLQLLYLFRE